MRKTWRIKTQDNILKEKLAEELKIHPVIASLLINRNIESPQDAFLFLNPELENLHSPFLLRDMDKAAERIKKALHKKETVLIYGDYDVDGITATALLVMAFSKMGLKVHTYIPDRLKEGYGLSKESIRFIKEKKIDLVITVDCGISSFEEVDLLNEAGIDVIITDHHQPRNKKLPKAFAVIDPHRESCGYPFKYLSGVGVAFKLAEAICGKFLKEYLDLVCLGTVSDIVPLTGENRVFAKYGLACLRETSKIGIRALIKASGLSKKRIDETHIGYILGPRINSTGRISSPNTSLKLLLTESEEEAEHLAGILNSENSRRQALVEDILKEALLKIEKEINFKYHKVMVLDKIDWHIGVIGIVASRLTDRFSRPTVIISTLGENCKGSARSVEDFHLFEALSECEEFLSEYGGHSQAAGFSMLRRNIEPFRDKINRIADRLLNADELMPKLDIDMEIGFGEIKAGLMEKLEVLSPYGEENPAPVFLTRNLFLKTDIQYFGKDNVRMWASDKRLTYEAVGFGLSEDIPALVRNDCFDLTYSPVLNSFKDENSIRLIIKDLRY